MIDADLIITNAREVITCAGPAPRRGSDQAVITAIPDGIVAAREGRIMLVGTPAARDDDVHVRLVGPAVRIDARGGTVLPGFVDSHTHVVYAGNRLTELQRRLAGATYAQIAAEGGGIISTVTATRRASDDDLLEQTRARLDEMLRCGTTTCEAKSGYGLETEAELKMLRVIRRLDAEHAIDLVPTFLGAHDVPPDRRDERQAFIDEIVHEMLPKVASERLAEWCDVFCETGVFTPEESRRILDAGMSHGLRPRVHADELGASGGSLVAAAAGARSADHLLFVPPDGIRALARAGVVATLLPTAAFYLKIGRYAPARDLIAAGVPVALATDVNPGGGFSPSMPFAIALACFAMNMTLEEALIGATLNGAYALDRHDRVGSLEVGKQMDALIVDGGATNLLRIGADAIRTVIKQGRIVVDRKGPRIHTD